jgi:K+-transporting ATPase A subunit
LLFKTNIPLIENSSIIGIIITNMTSFSGVLKSFKSSASNNGFEVSR